jgi:ZIP family zinc transporter
MIALLLSLVTFVSTLLGGLFALHRRRQLYLVMGFAAGILVGAALLDLLPEALDLAAATKGAEVLTVLRGAVIGFLVFYGLDRSVHLLAAGHADSHTSPHAGHTFGAAAALGLTIHSFLDGFAIGSGFRAATAIGVLVAIAVIAHDFGDGVSTVAVVLGAKGSTRASLGWLAADALAPVAGAAAATLLAIPPGLLVGVLGFFAGSFLFIGAAHLLPEAGREGKGVALPLAVVAGFAFIALVTQVV